MVFRLNGFFTITNFILHPSRRGSQRTDADIVGVRFPYRSEFSDGQGGDESEFARHIKKPYFVIAEVKRSRCELNRPWTDKKKRNIYAVLRDLGPFSPEAIMTASESLYEKGFFDSSEFYCSLFCVGETANPTIASRYPGVPQRTWDQILQFFFGRFQMYRKRKTDHGSRDQVGKTLWDCWSGSTNAQFIAKAKKEFGLITP